MNFYVPKRPYYDNGHTLNFTVSLSVNHKITKPLHNIRKQNDAIREMKTLSKESIKNVKFRKKYMRKNSSVIEYNSEILVTERGKDTPTQLRNELGKFKNTIATAKKEGYKFKILDKAPYYVEEEFTLFTENDFSRVKYDDILEKCILNAILPYGETIMVYAWKKYLVIDRKSGGADVVKTLCEDESYTLHDMLKEDTQKKRFKNVMFRGVPNEYNKDYIFDLIDTLTSSNKKK